MWPATLHHTCLSHKEITRRGGSQLGETPAKGKQHKGTKGAVPDPSTSHAHPTHRSHDPTHHMHVQVHPHALRALLTGAGALSEHCLLTGLELWHLQFIPFSSFFYLEWLQTCKVFPWKKMEKSVYPAATEPPGEAPSRARFGVCRANESIGNRFRN